MLGQESAWRAIEKCLTDGWVNNCDPTFLIVTGSSYLIPRFFFKITRLLLSYFFDVSQTFYLWPTCRKLLKNSCHKNKKKSGHFEKENWSQIKKKLLWRYKKNPLKTLLLSVWGTFACWFLFKNAPLRLTWRGSEDKSSLTNRTSFNPPILVKKK